ncbi:hypothetical protein HBI23_248880 [Parastagonospora nodorum]|nr:hypothetical protein HBI23_248880 [Parastagonospora nodorum]
MLEHKRIHYRTYLDVRQVLPLNRSALQTIEAALASSTFSPTVHMILPGSTFTCNSASVDSTKPEVVR